VPATPTVLQRHIFILLWIFICGLVISDATAIPLETEAKLLVRLIAAVSLREDVRNDHAGTR
jgi:hypothetical protein